ncbi:MAG: UDP-N-acetylmuramoyl-L-alanine--D-glutamate ligase [bacterium]|nr:UDP-N-acetylmuramoyl-L-alanine--D-glutamate ligase [bacterium]
MKNWRLPFEGKHITVMGLGVLGRGIADVRFLHEAGAILTVTDVKTAEELAPALDQLKDHSGITYVLGGHTFLEFENADYILKGAGVPLDSPYIQRAKEAGVAIKMDESWVAELAPKGVTFVGITGTRGKSTTTLLTHHVLKEMGASVYLGGNVPDAAMLPLLKELAEGDVVVMELSSWQLQGWYDAGISPHIGIFTNFMEDHLNYYSNDMDSYFSDKAGIFSHQQQDDLLVVSPDALRAIESHYTGDIASMVIVAEPEDVPDDWQLQVPGEHYRQLVALSLRALLALDVPEEVIKQGVESFKSAPGRLELLGSIQGARVYNDNHATIPAATRIGLLAVGGSNNVVLIMGGTSKGKGIVFDDLYPVVSRTCKHIVLLDESGSRERLDDIKKTGVPVTICANPAECVAVASQLVTADDVLLYSPGFASFGVHFKNEYDRGRQFVELLTKQLDR